MIMYLLRKAFCICVSVALAFCIVFISIFSISMFTFSSNGYIEKKFNSQAVTDELSASFYEKLDAISESNGIPSEVLRDALPPSFINTFPQIALDSIYKQRDYSLKNSVDIEGRCIDALNDYTSQSDKKLSEKKIDKIINETIQALDDTYKIGNVRDFAKIVSIFNQRRLTVLILAFAVIAVICFIILFFIMFGRRKLAFLYLASSFVTAGEILTATSILFMFWRISRSLSLTAINAYNSAIAATISVFLIALIVIGIILIGIGAAIFMKNYNYYSAKLKRADAEHQIEKDLL